MTTIVDLATAREHVARQRAEQGLPPRVEDPAALSRLALILTLPVPDAEPEPERAA